ncbi:LPXTG-motif cell wall anchor domain-containing protein/pilin isopeptide linkage domain-containing protein [Ruminococcus sp. YRD2003]|uniref:Spy0128 family protein n=1 Tax=Ruminococcus sp. YRD2003 TaxID=1452313 RepID=UPI0008C1F9FB|nr:LPXTG-motif cell wall anchor domain-containing protein/pilin isopeptide linkage domain-containing protein [Ruminococcus flavefaciens]
MGIPYNKYIQLLRESKKKRRQLACLVTALSVFVSGGVFWQLRGIGTAMVDGNLPTADDSGCDLTATPLGASELETQDVWEATLPTLTDIAGENLARIAESQLGYSESSINFVHAEDGETHNGYTRYGAWYGNPYGDWNTMFTYFCMNYAGIGSDDIPYGSGCWAWSLELDKGGLVVPVTRGSPARGDILLIDSDLDGKADRSCIVTAVSDDDIPEISAIEGDVDGEVAATAYLLDDEHLLGMVSLADIVPEPPVLPEEPAYVDFTAESESGIRVEAHADSFAFPSDTEMFVFDISRDDAIQTAAAHFGDADSDTIEAVAVDITFMTPDGSELEPAEGSLVSVNISLPEEHSLTGGEFSLLHVSDDGDVQEVADASVSADGAEFVAESFSVYVVTANGEKKKTDWHALSFANGQGNNTADNPYVVGVGENIFVTYEYAENENDLKFTVKGNDLGTGKVIDRTPGKDERDSSDGKSRSAYFTATNTGECRIVVGANLWEPNETISDSLYVKVIDSPVYMYVGNERIYFDQAMSDLNNTAYKTIYLLEDEKFKLSLNGTNRGNDFSVVDSTILTKGVAVNNGSNTDVEFTTQKHGETTITVNGQTINIVVKHPMYVKDSFHYRDIDRINEWVSAATSWIGKQNGYIANSNGYYPYQLFDGDNLTLKVPTRELTNAELVIGTPVFKMTKGDGSEETVAYTPDFTPLSKYSGDLSPHGGNIDVILSAKNESDYNIYVPIYLKDGNETVRIMHVKIPGNTNSFLDHADIEIADGGKYTVTKLKRSGSNITKSIVTYRAYVSGVNESILYESEDNSVTCQFYNKNDEPYPKDEITGYSGNQYYVDPNVPKGSPQYEFTSKYEIFPDGSLNWGSIGRIKFYPSEVDHAVFNVQLTLEPDTEVVYNADGTVKETNNIKGSGDKVLDNVPFTMNHQDVLDAYNKCPNHTGLDFTIMAFSALVEFDLEKKLTGADQLTDGQFKFGLFKNEDDTEPISTVTNNADGIVTFDTLHFEKPGSYTYYVKEIVDTPAADIIYDNKIMTLQIQVTENPTTNQLTANILTNVDDFKFTNHKTYTLPSTGGTGELPYIIFGGTMLAGAFTLLFIRRKKAAAR